MIAPPAARSASTRSSSKLGRGGMADVYLAQDTELGYTVALKLIEHSRRCRYVRRHRSRAARRGTAGAPGGDRSARRQGLRCGDADGYFFVAMEYIDGQDLAELMRHGPLAPEFAADVAIAVAKTLENAHILQVAIEGKEYPRHRARRYQAEEHPHRCARRGARAGFRHRQGALAFAPADAQRIRQRAVRFARAAGSGRGELRVGPVVAGRDALRDGRPACSPTRPRTPSGWSA